MRRPAHAKIQRSMIAAAVCAGVGAVLILPHVLTGRSQDPASITLIAGSWLVAVILLAIVGAAGAVNRRRSAAEATQTAVAAELTADAAQIVAASQTASAAKTADEDVRAPGARAFRIAQTAQSR